MHIETEMILSNVHRANARLQIGLALISALWVVLLATTVVISVIRETRLEVKTAVVLSQEMQAKSLIEGALEETIFNLLSNHSISGIQQVVNEKGFSLKIESLADRISLNAATQTELEKILDKYQAQSTSQMAEAIIDFRDADQRGFGGVREDRMYKLAGLPHGPKDKPFDHVSELSQIPKFDRQLVAKMSNDLTIFGNIEMANSYLIRLAKTIGAATVKVQVIVQMGGAKHRPYKVLRWEWTHDHWN